MSFVDRCGKPWIIEQEIQQITTVAIPSPIDANGSCVASQDAQSDCRPDDQNQDCVESCRLHRNHRLAQIVSGGPLVLAARRPASDSRGQTLRG